MLLMNSLSILGDKNNRKQQTFRVTYPVIEQPASNGKVADLPVIEQPGTENIGADLHITEQHVTEKIGAELPVAKQDGHRLGHCFDQITGDSEESSFLRHTDTYTGRHRKAAEQGSSKTEVCINLTKRSPSIFVSLQLLHQIYSKASSGYPMIRGIKVVPHKSSPSKQRCILRLTVNVDSTCSQAIRNSRFVQHYLNINSS